ncbi:MAG: GAF domain-containing protein, partial [Chloroflexi bacterium]|nr:GAF domain-containing protein [Chloroflexota bacterium]
MRLRETAVEPDPEVAKTAEAFFVIDDGQRIVEWSGGAALALGVGTEAAVGKPCYEVVGGFDPFGRAACGAKCPAFEDLQSGRLSGHRTLVLKRLGQQSLRLFCKLTALPKPPGGALVTLVESLHRTFATSQASLTTSAVETTRDLATLATLSSSLSLSSLDQGIEQTLEWLRQTTGAEAAELFLTEPGAGDLLLSAYSGLFRNAFAQITRFHPGEGFPGLVATTQAPIVTRDLVGDSRYLRTQVKERGFRSYVCVPLFLGSDRVAGSLNVASREATFDVDRTLRLLTWTGRVVSPFLESGLLHQRLSLAVPSVIGYEESQLGFDDVLHEVLRQMMTLGNASDGALYLYDQKVQGLVRRVTAGEFPGVACPDVRLGSPLSCPALAGGHGVALHGSRHLWPLACQQLSIRGGMVY